MSSTGDTILQEAMKKATSKGWFGGTANKEAACELYGQAGDAYKLDKEWKKSAEAYILQAELCCELKQDTDANYAYLNAAKAYKKINTTGKLIG